MLRTCHLHTFSGIAWYAGAICGWQQVSSVLIVRQGWSSQGVVTCPHLPVVPPCNAKSPGLSKLPFTNRMGQLTMLCNIQMASAAQLYIDCCRPQKGCSHQNK